MHANFLWKKGHIELERDDRRLKGSEEASCTSLWGEDIQNIHCTFFLRQVCLLKTKEEATVTEVEREGRQ